MVQKELSSAALWKKQGQGEVDQQLAAKETELKEKDQQLKENNTRLTKMAQERRALHKIIESKIQNLVNGISDGLEGVDVDKRTSSQVLLLKKIVDASVDALKAYQD